MCFSSGDGGAGAAKAAADAERMRLEADKAKSDREAEIKMTDDKTQWAYKEADAAKARQLLISANAPSVEDDQTKKKTLLGA